MPARRRRRSLVIRVLAAIAARVSFGVPAQAFCVRTTLPALMKRRRWPIIWRALEEGASRARARLLSPSPSDRPLMSRSNPAVLLSSSPNLRTRPGAHLGPRLALRSHRRNLKIGQQPAPRRARCLTRARCRKRGHFRKSGMSSQYLRHRRPRRCCSRSKSSDRSAAASRPRRCVAVVSLITTSVQPRQARHLLPLSSRARGELPQPPARRSARLRPRALPPRHATP
jgi:hypothetical protein